MTQATLSRDIHELGLVKTSEGYKLPQGEEAELSLPSIERLIETFVYDVSDSAEPGGDQDERRQCSAGFGGN